MDTETCVPDKQYMMPGKTEHRDAIPANKRDSVDDILSGQKGIMKTANHILRNNQLRRPRWRSSSPPPMEALIAAPDGGARRRPQWRRSSPHPMEALVAAITSPPYPPTDFQSVIANTVIPEKVRRNQTRPESPPTVPIHIQSRESYLDGMLQ